MPFQYTCLEHPEWVDDHLSGACDHVDDEHPDSEWMTLRDTGVLNVKFLTHEEVNNRTRYWIFLCRGCGVRVTRTSPPDEAKCESCVAGAIMAAHGG